MRLWCSPLERRAILGRQRHQIPIGRWIKQAPIAGSVSERHSSSHSSQATPLPSSRPGRERHVGRRLQPIETCPAQLRGITTRSPGRSNQAAAASSSHSRDDSSINLPPSASNSIVISMNRQLGSSGARTRADHGGVSGSIAAGLAHRTPKIQPSTPATVRSGGVRFGCRYRPSCPNRSASLSQDATVKASCWSGVRSSAGNACFQSDG